MRARKERKSVHDEERALIKKMLSLANEVVREKKRLGINKPTYFTKEETK